MNKLKSEYLFEFLFVLVFFILETFFRNELLLTFAVLVFGLVIAFLPQERKVKIWLWVIGTLVGFTIEVLMGFVSRSQFWNYGSLFGVPLWLPFIWGLGFEAIYLLGRFIRHKIK